MNLGQLLDHSFTYLNVTKTDADADFRRTSIEFLNELQRTALTMCEPPWAIREMKFITSTAYSGGSVTLTNGSSIITETDVAGNGWSDYLVGRKFVAASRLEWYEVVEYGTGGAGGRAQFRIDPPYQGETTTGSTYGIYQDEIDLPGDFRATVSVRNELVPRRLKYRDSWEQDHRIPRTFWSSTSNNFAPYVYTIVNRERRPVQWATNGACSVQFASDRITLDNFGTSSVTADDLRYRGASVRLSGTTTVVQLRNIVSVATAGGRTTATAQMYEPWRGTAFTNTGYEVVPKGQQRIMLWPVPNTATVLHVRYYYHPEPMVVYEDVPVLPVAHHDYLWKGLAYQISTLSGAQEAQGQREALYRDWKEAEARMKHALSPNEDSLIIRRPYGRGAYPMWDGPLLPDSYPAQWAEAGSGDDSPWPI